MRWGILSTARINQRFIAGARAAGHEVRAVASRDGGRAAEYARAQGIPRAHGSYEALLHDPDIEAVYVSLPNSLHAEWSERALRAGRHVLCEKPLGRQTAAVERACAAAAGSGLVLMEGFMYRHAPQMDRLLELIRSGRIGAVREVNASFSFLLAEGPNVRLDTGLDGGALMDVGCYCVHAARLLSGQEPVAVSAEQVLGRQGVDVSFGGLLRFASGVIATFDAGIRAAPRGRLEVVGEAGAVELSDPWHAREPAITVRSGDGIEHMRVAAEDVFARQAKAFAAAVVGDDEVRCRLRDDAAAQARALEQLTAAAGAS